MDTTGLKFIKFDKRGSPILVDDSKKILCIVSCKLNESVMEGIKDLKQTFHNDRFSNYELVKEQQLNLLVIQPYLPEDYEKYVGSGKKKFIETYEHYRHKTLPLMKQQDLSWMDNIHNKITEQENMLYQDDDFMFLPDMKWDRQNANQMYCLAIVKDRTIHSIRELTAEHIPLLEKIRKISCATILEKYGIAEDQLRIYFHYPPSAWRLHVHFNLFSNDHAGSSVDCAISLTQIINNIKLIPNYYQLVDLEIIV